MSISYTNIKIIAEKLRADYKHQKKVAVLIGAGVSKSAKIPLASEIVERIKTDFPETCKQCPSQEYAYLMNIVSPNYRRQLINDYIKASKLNAAHLYLASLVKNEYIDRILTTNFDHLAMKALALEHIFPGIYDVATAQNFNPKVTADKSIFHLHGQIDGYTILNTNDEIKKHLKKIKAVIDESIADRTFIVIGYSGENDYVIDQFIKVKEYNNFLYWVRNKDEEQKGKLLKLFDGKHKGVHYLKGYDADSFFVSLVRELKIDIPRIISKPFSYLDEVIENVVEIPKNDQMEVSVDEVKDWIKKAKKQYEEKPSTTGKTEIDRQKIRKMVREAWQTRAYYKIKELEKLITIDSDEETKMYLAYLIRNCGNEFVFSNERRIDIQDALEKSIRYFKKAEAYYSKDADLYFDWGYALDELGQLKAGLEAEKLYQAAIEKYKKATKLKPDDGRAWNNQACSLLRLFHISKEDKQAILDEVLSCCGKANEIEPGKGLYNMACAYSLLQDKAQAMDCLQKAKAAGTLASKQLIQKDKDLDYLRDEPEFREFVKNLKD